MNEVGVPRQENPNPTNDTKDTGGATWIYPFDSYPPYGDPEDWHELVGNCDERTQVLARQLADRASRQHVERHNAHDHPFCVPCVHRLDKWERQRNRSLPLVTPDKIQGIPLLHFKHWLSDPDAQAQVLKSETTAEAAHRFFPEHSIEKLELTIRWLDEKSDARHLTFLRACRYLVTHGGRVPEEPWPNLPTAGALDDLYLDRDQLDELQPVPQLIEGWLPRNSYGLLIGRDGTFKSFIAIDKASCLATGRPWHGHATEQVRVLYIAAEGAHGIAKRIQAWEAANGVKVDPKFLEVRTAALNMHRPGPDFDHLLRHVENGGHGYVVVDTLRRVSGGADGNSSDMGVVVDNIERIKRATHNGTVEVVAHTGKTDIDARGFSGIEDDCDFVTHVKRDGQLVELKNTKFKDGPDGHTLNLRARTIQLDDNPLGDTSLVLEDAGAPKPVMPESHVQLLEALDRFPDSAYSGELLRESKLSKSTYHLALKALLENGQIVNISRTSRPRYVSARTNVVQHDELPLHLHKSNDVQDGPDPSGGSPTGPAALIGRDLDHDDTDTDTPKETDR